MYLHVNHCVVYNSKHLERSDWFYLKVPQSDFQRVSDSLRPHGLYSPWNSPGQNTGVGRLSLLQGIFPIQGLNPGLLHCRWILYQLSHLGSPWLYKDIKMHFSLWDAVKKLEKQTQLLPKGILYFWISRTNKYSPRQQKVVHSCHFLIYKGHQKKKLL